MTKVHSPFFIFLVFMILVGSFVIIIIIFKKMFLAETYPIEDKKGNDEEIL